MGVDEEPWDLYREIHKALRFALFGVTSLAGSTDGADDGAVQRLVEEWHDVRLVLLGHHHHEDAYCDPLIARHAPALRGVLEVEHDAAVAAIDRLEATAHSLLVHPATARADALQGFHLDLADFTAQYLQHLHFEEREVMPVLNVAMNNADLSAVTEQIRGSVSPVDMCVFMRYMLPPMTFPERVDMLGGMHAGAPAEIFELFRAAAEASLPVADYLAVAHHCGFD